jgi:SecD/SecF fusion protein
VPPDGFEAQFLESRRHGSDSIHREVLWVKLGSEISPRSIQLAYLTKVLGGRFEVTVEFTAKGKEQFAAITRELADERRIDGRPRRLAIVADGQVLAAPVIMMPLREGRATITGSFTEREALEFCNRLNTPLHLPSIIEQYSE